MPPARTDRVPVSYRFPETLKAEIAEAAYQARMPATEYVRQAIREKLDRDAHQSQEEK